MLYYGTLFPFLKNCCAAVTKKYWALKKEELLNPTILLLFNFGKYVIFGGHILNISETIFAKLIFPLRLGEKLPDVLLQDFYTH